MLLLFSLCFGLFVLPVVSLQWFVDAKVGNDSADGLSSATAWKSLQKVADSMSAIIVNNITVSLSNDAFVGAANCFLHFHALRVDTLRVVGGVNTTIQCSSEGSTSPLASALSVYGKRMSFENLQFIDSSLNCTMMDSVAHLEPERRVCALLLVAVQDNFDVDFTGLSFRNNNISQSPSAFSPLTDNGIPTISSSLVVLASNTSTSNISLTGSVFADNVLFLPLEGAFANIAGGFALAGGGVGATVSLGRPSIVSCHFERNLVYTLSAPVLAVGDFPGIGYMGGALIIDRAGVSLPECVVQTSVFRDNTILAANSAGSAISIRSLLFQAGGSSVQICNSLFQGNVVSVEPDAVDGLFFYTRSTKGGVIAGDLVSEVNLQPRFAPSTLMITNCTFFHNRCDMPNGRDLVDTDFPRVDGCLLASSSLKVKNSSFEQTVINGTQIRGAFLGTELRFIDVNITNVDIVVPATRGVVKGGVFSTIHIALCGAPPTIGLTNIVLESVSVSLAAVPAGQPMASYGGVLYVDTVCPKPVCAVSFMSIRNVTALWTYGSVFMMIGITSPSHFNRLSFSDVVGTTSAFFAQDSDVVSVSYSTFERILTHERNGGVVNIISSQVALIANCVFTNCSAPRGGAIAIESAATVSVSDSTFQSCSARADDAQGGAVLLLLDTVNVYSVTVSINAFRNCSAYRGAAIYSEVRMLRPPLVFARNQFDGNTATQGIVALKQTDFQQYPYKLYDSVFRNNNGAVPGLYVVNVGSSHQYEHVLRNVSFINSVGDGNVLSAVFSCQSRDSKFRIENCKFFNSRQLSNILSACILMINSTTFEQGEAALKLTNGASTTLEHCRFSKAKDDAVIRLLQPSSLEQELPMTLAMVNCEISQQRDKGTPLPDGSGQGVIDVEHPLANVTLDTCRLIDNDRGLNIDQGQRLLIRNSLFRDNRAAHRYFDGVVVALGGALSIDALQHLTLDRVTFRNNSAQFGGAVFAKTNIPFVSCAGIVGQNNNAAIAGGTLFTYLLQNNVTVSQAEALQFCFQNCTKGASAGCYGQQMASTAASIQSPNIASTAMPGEPITFLVELRDFFDQFLRCDDGQSAHLEPYRLRAGLLHHRESTSTFDVLSSLSSVNVTVVIKADEHPVVVLDLLTTSDQVLLQYNRNISLTPCKPGYAHSATNVCTECPVGTFSLTSDAQKCEPTPDGVISHGGTKIFSEQGYWTFINHHSGQLETFACEFGACLEGSDTELNQCAVNRTGELCANCPMHMTPIAPHDVGGAACLYCDQFNVPLIFVMVIGLFGLAVYIHISSRFSGAKIKILFYYTQILTVCLPPQSMDTIFGVFSFHVSAGSSSFGGFCFAPLDSFQLMIARLSYPLILLLCLLVVFSLQRLAVALSRCCCKQRSANTIELLDDNDDDENDQHWNPDYDEEISQPDVDSDAPLSAAESEVPEVYQESSASTRSSLSSFARSKLSIIWTQSSQSDSFFAWHRFARTALAIALLTFSVLLQTSLKLFNCHQVGEQLLMVSDGRVNCATPTFSTWRLISFTVLLPIVFFVFFGLLAFLILHKKRNFKESPSHDIIFSILYGNYTQQCFYWEATILLRRLVISAISVFVPSGTTQVAFLLATNLIALTSTWFFKPYNDLVEFRLDILCLTSIVFNSIVFARHADGYLALICLATPALIVLMFSIKQIVQKSVRKIIVGCRRK